MVFLGGKLDWVLVRDHFEGKEKGRAVQRQLTSFIGHSSHNFGRSFALKIKNLKADHILRVGVEILDRILLFDVVPFDCEIKSGRD